MPPTATDISTTLGPQPLDESGERVRVLLAWQRQGPTRAHARRRCRRDAGSRVSDCRGQIVEQFRIQLLERTSLSLEKETLCGPSTSLDEPDQRALPARDWHRGPGRAGSHFATKRDEGPETVVSGPSRWWRGQDLNLRPSGYEPDELPNCSTPRRSGPQEYARWSALTTGGHRRRSTVERTVGSLRRRSTTDGCRTAPFQSSPGDRLGQPVTVVRSSTVLSISRSAPQINRAVASQSISS